MSPPYAQAGTQYSEAATLTDVSRQGTVASPATPPQGIGNEGDETGDISYIEWTEDTA